MTPENWFNLSRRARLAVGAPLSLTLTGPDGCVPVAALSLAELRALHQTFQRWWRELGATPHDGGLADGAYDTLMSGSRALLQARATAVLAAPDAAVATPPALLHFPESGASAPRRRCHGDDLSHAPLLAARPVPRSVGPRALERR